MPRSDFGDGLTWWLHTRAVVEGESEVNLANVTVVVTDKDTAAVLQTRSAGSGDVVTLTTNSRGETPAAFYLPRVQATLSAGGSTYLSTTAELDGVQEKLDEASAAVSGLGAVYRASPWNPTTDSWQPLDPVNPSLRVSTMDASATAPPGKASDLWARLESE